MPRRTLLAMLAGGALVLGGCGGPVAGSPEASTPPSQATDTMPPATADHVAIPRTRILLRVPGGMQVDGNLPGIVRPGSHTSVAVLELPTEERLSRQELVEIAAAVRDAEARGFQFDEVRDVTVAGFPAVAMTGTQDTGMGTSGKAIVVVAADDAVVRLIGSIEAGEAMSSAQLLDVLLDARWSEQPAPRDLGIDISPAPGYERQEGATSSIVMTLGGELSADVPTLLASPLPHQTTVEPAQQRAFAAQQFRQLPGKPTEDSTTELTIAGLPGFETVGHTEDGKIVYLVVLFRDDGYILLGGDYDPARHPDQLPAFRAMARSLEIG